MYLGVQPTTVSYLLVDDQTLQLTGKGAFNYSIKVTVECDSQTNFVAKDEQMVEFTNHTIAMGDDYDKDMHNCEMAAKMAMGLMRTVPQAVPRGGDPPLYGEVVQILREAVLQGKAGANEALIEGVRVYGSRLVVDLLGGLQEGSARTCGMGALAEEPAQVEGKSTLSGGQGKIPNRINTD